LNITENTLVDKSNRILILNSLENSKWPISKEDFNQIEDQIDLAKEYLRLSRNLSEFLRKKKEIKINIEAYSDSDQEQQVEVRFCFYYLIIHSKKN
jgi:hypothetical protein